jgi:hypothetical protein
VGQAIAFRGLPTGRVVCDKAGSRQTTKGDRLPHAHDMLSDVITLRNTWGGLLPTLLFALSGVLGAALFLAEIKAESDWVYIVPALPFGIACAFLCLRPVSLAIAAAATYTLIWAGAFYTGAYLCGKDVNQYVAMLPAGLIGGVGVAGLTSIDAPRLRSFSSLAVAAAIGAFFGLPFALYAKPSDFIPLSEETVLRLSFALWQAAVGTYVYRIGVVSRATSSAA